MTKDDLKSMSDQLGEEIARRKKLGGYSMEADGLMIICTAVKHLTDHLLDTYPRKKNVADI